MTNRKFFIDFINFFLYPFTTFIFYVTITFLIKKKESSDSFLLLY